MPAALQGKPREFKGYLFSKLKAIGTRSEGPGYFLELNNYQEVPVVKKARAWEKDPKLHRFLDTKVVILGRMNGQGIDYDKVIAQ